MNCYERLVKGKLESLEAKVEFSLNFLIVSGYRTYGIVYRAQNKVNGTYVAIKKFKDSDDDEYVSISPQDMAAGPLILLFWAL